MHKKHSLPTCAGIALTLLLLTDATARADLLWGYNWEPSSGKIYANGGGTGYLTLTDEPANSATGSSNTVVTNIQAFSTAPSTNPDIFNQAPVSFTLTLQDVASKATDNLTFSGYFSGYLTANSANVQLSFTSQMSETVTLGGNKYDVQVGTYTPPGPPGVTNSGSLNAFVTVTPLSGGGHTSGTPEPAALTLACLAFPFAGLYGWRKRRVK
jgi:hypothetical protein